MQCNKETRINDEFLKLKQDIINFDKIKTNHTTIIQFILEQTGSYWDRPILPPIPSPAHSLLLKNNKIRKQINISLKRKILRLHNV